MRAFTLVEVIVALAVTGVGLGVVGLSVRSLQPSPGASVLGGMAAARDNAIRMGRHVTFAREQVRVRFAPDGSASGSGGVLESLVVRVDLLTGDTRVARR